MTVEQVFRSGVNSDAFKAFYALQREGVQFNGGVKGLARILDWSESKTSNVLQELQSRGFVRVDKRYHALARIFVCGSDLPASVGQEDRQQEPGDLSLESGISNSEFHSCSDGTDSTSTCTSEQSESDELSNSKFDPSTMPDLSETFPGAQSDPTDDLQMRMRAIAFKGIEWALRTFDHKLIGDCLEVIEDLVRDGVSYNPGGLLNSALRGKCFLFRPEQPSEKSPEPTSQVEPIQSKATFTAPEDSAEDIERRKELAEASPHREQWEQIKAKLSGRIHPQSVASWFEPCFIQDVTEHRVVLSAASLFAAEWIIENYEQLLRELFRRDVEVVVSEEVRSAA